MMNLYMVYRLDRSDGQAEAIRAATRPQHRLYMDQFAARVRLGGPVLDAEGRACGGLMLIEAENEEAVRAIVAADPFEIAGLSAQIEIRPFRWQTKRPADLPQL
jgi:uncharacterized protein YciI